MPGSLGCKALNPKIVQAKLPIWTTRAPEPKHRSHFPKPCTIPNDVYKDAMYAKEGPWLEVHDRHGLRAPAAKQEGHIARLYLP